MNSILHKIRIRLDFFSDFEEVKDYIQEDYSQYKRWIRESISDFHQKDITKELKQIKKRFEALSEESYFLKISKHLIIEEYSKDEHIIREVPRDKNDRTIDQVKLEISDRLTTEFLEIRSVLRLVERLEQKKSNTEINPYHIKHHLLPDLLNDSGHLMLKIFNVSSIKEIKEFFNRQNQPLPALDIKHGYKAVAVNLLSFIANKKCILVNPDFKAYEEINNKHITFNGKPVKSFRGDFALSSNKKKQLVQTLKNNIEEMPCK